MSCVYNMPLYNDNNIEYLDCGVIQYSAYVMYMCCVKTTLKLLCNIRLRVIEKN